MILFPTRSFPLGQFGISLFSFIWQEFFQKPKFFKFFSKLSECSNSPNSVDSLPILIAQDLVYGKGESKVSKSYESQKINGGYFRFLESKHKVARQAECIITQRVTKQAKNVLERFLCHPLPQMKHLQFKNLPNGIFKEE